MGYEQTNERNSKRTRKMLNRQRSFVLLENSLSERGFIVLYFGSWNLLLRWIFLACSHLLFWMFGWHAHTTEFMLMVDVVFVFIHSIPVFADYYEKKRSPTQQKKSVQTFFRQIKLHILFAVIHTISTRKKKKKRKNVYILVYIHYEINRDCNIDPSFISMAFFVVFQWVHNITNTQYFFDVGANTPSTKQTANVYNSL